MHKGSCQCGKVAFQVEGDFEHFFLCHCQYCQKDTGSAHAANLFSTSATLTWLRGEEQVRTYQVPDSRHVKGFCSCCGAALPSVQMEGQLLVVPAGALDTPAPLKPNAHLFVASRANWDQQLEQLPCFAGLPES
ncbi:GFA family protein [Pseudidiomarina sediminum]|uniref:GFA family protein n=1 Tax=Pseudidiomarina sediminum TaxID=431675 RepID=A0A432Z8Q9_9GAMM|nr:GFA family protein [Pseudidiomarina sediminum]RUO74293.1 GFA family protein [Pseudidiomarina sediminum]